MTPKLMSIGRMGCLPNIKVWTKSHGERQCTVVCMSHSGHLILQGTIDMAGMGSQHVDECEVESLTDPISFGTVGCSM